MAVQVAAVQAAAVRAAAVQVSAGRVSVRLRLLRQTPLPSHRFSPVPALRRSRPAPRGRLRAKTVVLVPTAVIQAALISGAEPAPRSSGGFDPSASGPPSDPNLGVGVTTLLRKLDSPSSQPPISAPVPPSAPSAGSQGGSWTSTFDSPSSSSSFPEPQSATGGYAPVQSAGSEATRAMSMQPAASAPSMPTSSGPSEVTRILNASKLREAALRQGPQQGAAPGAPGAPPSAPAPGMPAIPGIKLPAPQFSPQSLMNPGGMGASASASAGGIVNVRLSRARQCGWRNLRSRRRWHERRNGPHGRARRLHADAAHADATDAADAASRDAGTARCSGAGRLPSSRSSFRCCWC